MKCYLDSSVILRKLFGESKPLREWKKIEQGFSSRLLHLECFRTIDRLRLSLSPEESTNRLCSLRKILKHIGILPVSEQVWLRAEEPFTTPLGSLDSIHLATALLWKKVHGDHFLFATHDHRLGLAAQSHGFEVIGL